ncbi:SSH4 family protein [Aspergillus undulatus]|uniref:SSH4 family protein n=1 Tax=Aspergillus undulatus TaxID=1810928 RepID=UPI003CCC9E36
MENKYPPPPGPPPGYEPSAPPPYHNWQEAVPDTAEFPPPPVSGNYNSNTGNASSDDAERAHDFCNNTPLYYPAQPPAVVYGSVQNYDIGPVLPAEFRGTIAKYQRRWKGHTRDRNGDCVLLTNLPLYFAMVDSPFIMEGKKTIYFEVKILGLRAGPTFNDASGLSIGFAAQPYPTWRSPGWERGSLGVFSDDGCRFVNDSWGGRDFTEAFRVGETVGIGMTFQLPEKVDSTPKLDVQVFFTRNGQRVGGWDLHEEVDEEAGGIQGLRGDFDLYPAVGFFGGVDFEICYHAADWLFRP